MLRNAPLPPSWMTVGTNTKTEEAGVTEDNVSKSVPVTRMLRWSTLGERTAVDVPSPPSCSHVRGESQDTQRQPAQKRKYDHKRTPTRQFRGILVSEATLYPFAHPRRRCGGQNDGGRNHQQNAEKMDSKRAAMAKSAMAQS
jgi:hypothetical protein